MPARKTTEQFITAARARHGDRYGYLESHYVKVHDEVRITCKNHGAFLQTPANHIHGRGCPGCANDGRRKGLAAFIAEAQVKHGDCYDYSQVKYFSAREYVQIICRVHGPFPQSPGSHLKGAGCPACVGKNRDTARFIVEAMAKHGGTYDYSQAAYTFAHHDLKIVCKIHGLFLQSPSNHLRGQGCSKCSGRNWDTSIFIAEAKAKHGNTYGYSLVSYSNGLGKVEITCKIHGSFWQTPHDHVNGGRGCPKCGRKRTMEAKRQYHCSKAQDRFSGYAEVFRKMLESPD
jgi:hypothetical protein